MKHLNLALLLVLAPLLTACPGPQETQMVGTLERDRIEIKVESSEPILSRHVLDGEAVRSGDLLIRQDPSRLQAHLDQVLAQRDQVAARLAELQRGPRPEAIRETRARLAAAEAQTVNAQAELARGREVFDRGLSSQSALDQAEARWKSAVAEERAVREALQAQLAGTTREELDQASAAVQVVEAQLARIQLDLDRTELRTPVDGIVDKMLFQVGERPPPGTTVAVVLDSSRVFARFYVPEYLRAEIVPGHRLQAAIDGIDKKLTGTVRWVSTDASFTPYFALTEHDRSRLSYLAEMDLPDASELPSGTPLVVVPAEQ